MMEHKEQGMAVQTERPALFFSFVVEKMRNPCVKDKYKIKKEMGNYVNCNRPWKQTDEDDSLPAFCIRAGGKHHQTIRQQYPGISG